MAEKTGTEDEPQVIRVNRGYKLREDLIKRCKKLAIDTDRHLYDVMEAALEEYLKEHEVKV